MNRDDVKKLLAFASSVDARMPQPDPAVVDGWWLMLGEVPVDAGARAVRAYYTSERYLERREPLTPGDIVQFAAARTRPEGASGPAGGLVVHDAERREPRRALTVDEQRHHDGVDRVLAAWQAAKAIRRGEDPELAVEIAEGETAVRREFLSRPCSWCGAGEGQPCTVPSTGERLTRSPAHDARIHAAQVAAAGTSREQALAALEQHRPALESLPSN